MEQNDNAGHDVAGELTEESVAETIGEGWEIDVDNALNATVLCVDWDNKFVYCDDHSKRRGAETSEEHHGHVSVYPLYEGWRADSKFFLRAIAAEAEGIAKVSQGSVCAWWDTHFASDPYDLFERPPWSWNRGDGVYMRYDVDQWLSDPCCSISDVCAKFGKDKSVRLEALIEAIIKDAKVQYVVLDYGDVKRYLAKDAKLQHDVLDYGDVKRFLTKLHQA